MQKIRMEIDGAIHISTYADTDNIQETVQAFADSFEVEFDAVKYKEVKITRQVVRGK